MNLLRIKQYGGFAPFGLILLSALTFSSCSVKKIAVNSVANALTEEGSSVFASDNDPELVADALPFALKTMEALLESTPRHQRLLIGTAAGFTQYGHAFVLQPAIFLEFTDFEKSRAGRERARKLFLRARDYGLRALELNYPGIREGLAENAEDALRNTKKEDVPALYWTGVAWISAISTGVSDMGLVADLPLVTALLERSLVLDESWEKGAIHEVFIPLDASRSEAEGGGIDNARQHFLRAMQLNGGKSVAPSVSFAESVCVKLQDRQAFEEILQEVIAFDAEQYPEFRLSNILSRRKAEFLLENIDAYFL